jgi:hypothetical protein
MTDKDTTKPGPEGTVKHVLFTGEEDDVEGHKKDVEGGPEGQVKHVLYTGGDDDDVEGHAHRKNTL